MAPLAAVALEVRLVMVLLEVIAVQRQRFPLMVEMEMQASVAQGALRLVLLAAMEQSGMPRMVLVEAVTVMTSLVVMVVMEDCMALGVVENGSLGQQHPEIVVRGPAA
jgi:hypothetical protein